MDNKEQKKEYKVGDDPSAFASNPPEGFIVTTSGTEAVTPPKALREEDITREDLLNYIRDTENRNWEFMEEQVLKAEMAWNNKLKQDRERIKERVLKGEMRSMEATYGDDRNGKYFHIDDILQILDEEQL